MSTLLTILIATITALGAGGGVGLITLYTVRRIQVPQAKREQEQWDLDKVGQLQKQVLQYFNLLIECEVKTRAEARRADQADVESGMARAEAESLRRRYGICRQECVDLRSQLRRLQKNGGSNHGQE